MVGFVSMRLSRNFGVFEGVVIVLILVITKIMIEMRRKVKARFWSY
jgi:hypothetical protein